MSDADRQMSGAPAAFVRSESDERTINNTMLHQYRVLSEAEKLSMQRLRDKGLELYTLLHEVGGSDPSGDRFASRELSLAATNVEQAVMWAVKHLTK